MKKLILAFTLAFTALLLTAPAALSAQPDYTGAPRSAKVWLNSDPSGFDQLKYLAGRDAILSVFDAATTAAVIAEINRAQVAEGILSTNWVGQMVAETNRAQVAEAVLRTNWVAQVIAETNRARVAEGALASAITPVTNALVLFAGGFLKSDGTNVFYISRDFVYTNALTTNNP